MKINSINKQSNRQNFNGLADSATKFISKHPGVVAGLAGSSVIAQKIVMSGSEAAIGPVIDIGIGKAITKYNGEQDDRTNQSSKTQAIRTFSQAVGGTIVGIVIRGLAIGAMCALALKAGKKAKGDFGKLIAKDTNENAYKLGESAASWGKALGGAAATLVMMVTNFIIDVPVINAINKKVTEIFNSDKKEDKGVK